MVNKEDYREGFKEGYNEGFKDGWNTRVRVEEKEQIKYHKYNTMFFL